MKVSTFSHDQEFQVCLGKFLREKRRAKGLTQKQVGQSLNYSSSQFVSLWERGHAFPPLETIKKLIELYDLDTDELLRFYEVHLRRILREQCEPC